ncbi:hypothetical protein E2C01_025785 [Portunus trituberculatus]|uniref:Uncharacterized protein n=1 Tax=Portunus trituberculatus TaxID=210409 RepID=A0A5B7EE65_PORTR|nr:hypothetical protein [Portunus trituberculatus]
MWLEGGHASNTGMVVVQYSVTGRGAAASESRTESSGRPAAHVEAGRRGTLVYTMIRSCCAGETGPCEAEGLAGRGLGRPAVLWNVEATRRTTVACRQHLTRSGSGGGSSSTLSAG